MPFQFAWGNFSGNLTVRKRTYYMATGNFNNWPKNGQSIEDAVKAVSLQSCLFNSIPVKLNETFNNLVALEVIQCGLVVIRKEDLKPFTQLKDLWLRNNEIRVVPQDLFLHNRQLEIVSFKGNKIEQIGELLLKPLNNLLFADFRDNVLINMHYEMGSSDGVSLEILNNNIKTISQRTTSPVSNLDRKLWETRQLSDFTIKVHNDVEFKVHKCVLSVSSPVFEAMFVNDTKEKLESEMELPDFSAEVVEEFLKFLYIRTMPSEVNFMDVFGISAKYQVEDLMKICGNLMVFAMNIDNAMEVFMLGDAYANNFIKSSAFSVIQTMFPNTTLPTELINHPEKLKKIVEAKKSLHSALQEAEAKLSKL